MAYTLPSGTTAAPGQKILSSVWNAAFNSIAVALNLKKSTTDIETAAKGGTGISTNESTGVPVIDGGTWSVGSTLPVTKGGTGSATAAAALSALGAAPASRYPRGYLYGLTLSNGTDATNDIDIAVGECTSDDAAEEDRVLIANAAVLTKQLDAAWAVGTDKGGLDTGSIADYTYAVWLIKRVDTNVVDVVFSTNATSPAMPTGYTKKRRIGSILRESSAIVAFTQTGNLFMRAPVQAFTATNVGTAAVQRQLLVPVGIKVQSISAFYTENSAAAEGVYISDLAMTDLAPDSGVAMNLYSPAVAVAAVGVLTIVTNTSGYVRSRHKLGNAATTFAATSLGWIDERGT
jgi:hypothetical protein